MTNNFLDTTDHLERVLYFTAYAKWDMGKYARHSIFIKALEHVGVEVILGKFKKKYPICTNCFKRYKAREEKESDVNIAVRLVSMAYEDAFDVAIIVSGDSDFVSTVNFIKTKFPEKQIGVIVPGNPNIANDLRRSAHFSKAIERGHLLSSRLPNSITLQNGKTIHCPPEYLLPNL